jgi:hypothetical protein
MRASTWSASAGSAHRSSTPALPFQPVESASSAAGERQAVSLSLPRCPITRRWSRSWRSSTCRWWSAGYPAGQPAGQAARSRPQPEFRHTVFNR